MTHHLPSHGGALVMVVLSALSASTVVVHDTAYARLVAIAITIAM